MFALKGKTALVTGGAQGIGKGISSILAAQGAQVAIGDIDLRIAETTAAEIYAAGGKAMAARCDVTDLESVQAAVAVIKERFGAIGILVNNAGWDRMVPFVKTTPDFWDKVIDINYKGVLNCVYAVIQDMIAANGGRIINIGSDAARVGSMGEAVYAGAKGAVISFSKSLARETARNRITVNVVCPGPTGTPMTEQMQAESDFAKKILSKMDKVIPLNRMGTPEDIASAVVFLASDEAGFITGQTLSVSGGLTMS
ncbi:SDR family NAD(P)-dependent oxidoreductase [Desulfatitalea alkaliphila]|uniref:3-oxoacyl-ACP reductase FabG n=1 Tax=Desulfatitalea alkaliphila TaxID=2929485 RepID=A0AA41UJH0_9BACT|nr:3-oxoacyl-ACP reductase family protein [Desulfatitalea alkaliphila]MCJ8501119.1 3-oxoacyl-ACP reductase FabG [Desulfatitalea alkaliphila]